MRKFALSSSAYERYKLAQAIRHVALAGYSGIEIIADAPHGYPPLLTDADRSGIRSALAQNRLALSNINAAPMTALRDELRPSWIEADQVLRFERIHHTLDAGQLAKDIGAPTVSTLAGGPLDETMARETALRHFVAGLAEVASEARKAKFPPVLVCPQPGLLIETADQAIELIEQVRSPHVAVSLNTRHVVVAGGDLRAAVQKLAKHLRHVHIQDVAADGSGVVVPGTGAVDFAALFAALDAIKYKGWLTVDLGGADAHPDEAAKQALEFLARFDR